MIYIARLLNFMFAEVTYFSLCFRMLEYSLDGHNVSFSAIRTVRVLRPLRAINRVPSEFCFPSIYFHPSRFSLSVTILQPSYWFKANDLHSACCIYRFTHAQSRRDSHDVLTWSPPLIVSAKCPQSNMNHEKYTNTHTHTRTISPERGAGVCYSHPLSPEVKVGVCFV